MNASTTGCALRFRCIDSSPQGPNVPQVAAVFRPGTPTQDGEMSDSEPTLAQVGEFGVIDRINAGRHQPAAVVLGPGDDAAVVTAADGRTVVSTDMLVQDSHFRLDWSTPHDIGRKAIAQNAADIEAKGAKATAHVVGIGAPRDTRAAQAV